MNILTIAKTASEILVAGGVGAIVGNAVKATTPPGLKLPQQIIISVGAFALTGMAGKKSADYVTEKIDETVDNIKEIKTTIAAKKSN